jgi:hypothetical protein
MKPTRKPTHVASAESIARLADAGKNISSFFTNNGRMMKPIQRVNVDFTAPMLEELDRQAQALNISRQAVIKSLLRLALDQHYSATSHRSVGKNRPNRALGRPSARTRSQAS